MSNPLGAVGLNLEEHADIRPASHDYSEVYNRYHAWWTCADGATGEEADEAREKRQRNANQLAIDYYDLVSPSYEQGWGQQFHYCPMTPGSSIRESLVQYEILVGKLTGLKEGMRVLDVGCGLSGPARTIAKFFKVNVVGLTNSPWHVERGRQLNEEAGLDGQVEVVQGDFNHLPFEDDTFDAAYAFEAICYAVDPKIVYKELRRVLKPGAAFGLHEWVMTDKYDPEIKEHRVVHDQIERGNGMTNMPLVDDLRQGLKECGFVTTHEERMEYRSSPGPWYYPLLGMVSYATCKEDFWTAIMMERWLVVPFFDVVFWLLAKMNMVPREFPDAFEIMKTCTKSVAMGSKMGIFSPMTVFISKNVK